MVTRVLPRSGWMPFRMGTRQLRTCRATRVARQAQRGPELEAVPRRRAPANDRGTPVRRCSRGEGPEAPGPSPFFLRTGNGTHSRPLRARPPPGAARGLLWFSYWLFAPCRAARAPAEPPGPGADALTGRSSEERIAAGPFVPGERTMPALRFRIFRTPEVAHQHVSQSRSPGGRQPSSLPTVGPSGRCARGPPRHRRKGSHPLPWEGLPPAGTVVPSLADRRGARKALLALGRRTGHHRRANPCARRDRGSRPTGGGLWGAFGEEASHPIRSGRPSAGRVFPMPYNRSRLERASRSGPLQQALCETVPAISRAWESRPPSGQPQAR